MTMPSTPLPPMTQLHSWSRATSIASLCALATLLAACSALPSRPSRPVMYDFGPGPLTVAAPDTARLPLALGEVEPAGVLDGSTAVLYRLAYSDAQQLRPYAQARWSMPAAQLVRQRLRDQLGQQRNILSIGESAAQARTQGVQPLLLRVDLDEFSQLFDSPIHSVGLLRLRVTLVESTPAGERLLGQRQVIVQHPAPSPDAPGGVQALATATDTAAQEIAHWLEQLGR